jgi:hypothetical protein
MILDHDPEPLVSDTLAMRAQHGDSGAQAKRGRRL